MICGRTELIKSVSRAKFDAPSDFEVRFALAPQKTQQNQQTKLILCVQEYFRGRKFASKNIFAGESSRPRIFSRAKVRARAKEEVTKQKKVGARKL